MPPKKPLRKPLKKTARAIAPVPKGLPEENKVCSTKVTTTLQAFPAIKLYDEIVVVEVGPSKKRYYLHRGLLCHHSTYFTSALKDKWKKTNEGLVKLHQDDETIFDAFYSWLYTRRVIPHDQRKGEISESQRLLLCKVWVFGDIRGVPELQDAAMDRIIELSVKSSLVPSRGVVEYVYDNTTEGTALRNLLVDELLGCKNKVTPHIDAESEKKSGMYHIEFYRDLALRMRKVTKQNARTEWKNVDKCRYHVH